MKRILMVYPRMPETFWGFRSSLKFTGLKSNFPPLGLLTVAAMLPPQDQITLIDMNVETLRDKDIRACDLVFVSAMIVQKDSMETVVRRCKRWGKTVVAGGPLVSSASQAMEGVDHFVLGEAEITLPAFLADWEAGHAEKVYSSSERPDITKTPVPRFDLIDHRKYYSTTLQVSRGCPFHCEFCDIIELFGRVPRVKTPQQFVAELDALVQRGYRKSVFIVDDNFIGNIVQVKKLLHRLISWQRAHEFPVTFFTEASVNLADDDELLGLMAEAGFTMVFLGIETPVEDTLLLTQKTQNTKKNLLASIRRIQEAGMEVSAGFILGFDNDPANIFQLQKDFIRDSAIPMAMVGLLTALPKTQLYRRLEAEDRIRTLSSGNNTFDGGLNFVPKMDRETLLRGYRSVLSAVYRPKAYFDRCWALLERLPFPQKPAAPSFQGAAQGLRALVNTFVRQGLSGYGPSYLTYLWKVLVRKRQFFRQAVSLAILGHHFFKMTKAMNAQASRSARRQLRFDGLLQAIEARFVLPPSLHLKKILKNTCDLGVKWFVELEKSFTWLKAHADAEPDGKMRSLEGSFKAFLVSWRGLVTEKARGLDSGAVRRMLQRIGLYKRRIQTTLVSCPERHGDLLPRLGQTLEALFAQTEQILFQRL